MLLLRWDPTNAAACSRTSPRSPDPRSDAAARHALATVLAVAVAAVLAGARSLVAIGEWAADAVDGETLRGSGHHGHRQVHLLAAMDHPSGAVLGQTDVDHTTNEIARFRPLLDGLDLAGRVITAPTS